MDTLIWILLASFVVSAISLIGLGFLIKNSWLNEKKLAPFVGFAAGVMLTTAFLDLLPEAVEHGEEFGVDVFPYVLIGVLLFFFLERFVIWFHHHDGHHDAKPVTTLVLIGDAFHNLFDGIAIAAAFSINPTAGILTTFAIAAHEIPSELADFSVLVHCGIKPAKALFYNFISALTAMVGALAGYFFLTQVEGLLPILLAFSAGMFIYIACSDLIPDMHGDFKQRRNWRQSIPFILGIALSYMIGMAFAH